MENVVETRNLIIYKISFIHLNIIIFRVLLRKQEILDFSFSEGGMMIAKIEDDDNNVNSNVGGMGTAETENELR